MKLFPVVDEKKLMVMNYNFTSKPPFIRTPSSIIEQLSPSCSFAWKKPRLERYQKLLSAISSGQWTCDNYVKLDQIYELVAQCHRRDLTAIHMSWNYAISAVCQKYFRYVSEDLRLGKQKHEGCGNCDGCLCRFAELTLCLVSCQGCSDRLTLPHWHYIFHHTKYSFYGFDDWCRIPIVELAKLCFCCSKYNKVAVQSLRMLRYVKYEMNGRLPRDLPDVMQVSHSTPNQPLCQILHIRN